MPFSDAEIRANREYFAHKLRAEKQRNDVLHTVQDGRYDFMLLDTRDRDAFAIGHIPGAWSAPLDQLDGVAKELPRNVGWKEWTYNRHPTHQGKPEGPRCECSK